MANKYTKKYAVGLSILANSFFDPDCGANLFKGSPIYQFNHKPTNRIVSAVKSGRLIDLQGNILEDKPTSNEAVDVKKIEKQLRAELEKEYAAKLEEAKAELTATSDDSNEADTDSAESTEEKPKKGSKK